MNPFPSLDAGLLEDVPHPAHQSDRVMLFQPNVKGKEFHTA